MTTLYGWGPMFGCQGPSSYVMKTDVQLQMFDVDYDCKIADLESVSKHKAPYVEDDGFIIEDSTFIRWHFEKKLGVDLDEGLNAEQRAIAWATERMLEDRLALIMVLDRWTEGGNFERGPIGFFMGAPEPIRGQIIAEVLGDLQSGFKSAGIGRHSRDERMLLAAKDIAAVAGVLGDKAFMMGAYPTALDAAAYGVLAACAAPVFETPLRDIVASHANLVAFMKRMEDRFYAEPRWPSLMPEAEAA